MLEGIKKSSVDDKLLWDVIAGLAGYHAVIVAHQLDLFSLLENKSVTIEEAAKLFNIDVRPTEVLLLLNANLGLLTLQNGKFRLSEHAKKYLIKTSPTYFGSMFELVNNNELTFEKLRKVVITNQPQEYDSGDIFYTHEQKVELAKNFTQAMHSISIAPAFGWVDKIDLKKHQMFLDIGGGSGAHTISVLSKWSQLKGIVLDIAPVCEVCDQMIEKYGFSSRASTCTADFWECEYPQADVHFYSQIYHDWPEKNASYYLKKVFNHYLREEKF